MVKVLNHVMVDLETLGTMAGCVGLSIGAVEMDMVNLRLGREFYIVVDRESSEAAYLRVEKDTADWWGCQSAEAQKVLHEAASGTAAKLPVAMTKFNTFLAGLGKATTIRQWGNGADFDNPILRLMYDAAGVKPYCSGAASWGGRCHRTMKTLDELFGDVFAAPKIVRGDGVHHHALDDAKAQAHQLFEIVRQVREAIR